MASVFCTQCGQQNPEDARFCARCGAVLTVPGEGGGLEVVVVSAAEADVHVIDRLTKQELLRLRVPAGGIVMSKLPHSVGLQ